jgi:glycosyltransferase involved in cell wall biosynthesis
MRRWAHASERLLLLAPRQRERAERLLEVDRRRCVVSPNGFDPQRFERLSVDRGALWRHHLVEQPRGWKAGEDEGSLGYSEAEVAPLACGPVAVSISRFTAVKRLPLLIRAWARATPRLPADASLVLVGGYPGEWEGEHPYDVIRAIGAPNVFLAGWHAHTELPELLAASDALVLASVREQFGSVLVEAMACGVPPIAVNRYGPADIVRDGDTGWLVEPDDEEQLTEALVACLTDPVERELRGERADRDAHERFSWPSIAERLAGVLDEVAGVADGRLAASA